VAAWSFLGIVLTLAVGCRRRPPSLGRVARPAALTAGSVLAANLFFFAAVKRIEAAPAAVAATIEPVVGTRVALLLFHQQLSLLGWLGLTMVVAGVAAGISRKRSQPNPEDTVACSRSLSSLFLAATTLPAPPTSGLPPQVGDTSPFRRLTLPPPT